MNLLRLKIKCLVVCLAVIAFAAEAAVKVGNSFPDLSKFKLEGELPAALKGKVLLVDCWASWCVPCAKSFPALNELQKSFGDRGLVIVAVSVDEKSDEMKKFLKKHAASFTVVRDIEHKLVEQLDVATMPTSFLIDREGKVRFVHEGFREGTKKQYTEEIESLLKGSP